jgi:hypothetical protein
MLSRFRMTARDCLHEYEQVSHQIFGQPRLVSQLNVGIVPWSKYDAKNMERAVQEVTSRRSENVETLNPVTFPTKAGVCNT